MPHVSELSLLYCLHQTGNLAKRSTIANAASRVITHQFGKSVHIHSKGYCFCYFEGDCLYWPMFLESAIGIA